MRTVWPKRVTWAAVAAAALAGLAFMAWPRPIPVDIAAVTNAAMEVTVDDDGKTRVRHVYTVSAPIAGKVLRISHPSGEEGMSLHVGDEVTANKTVVAIMQPTAPSFIDARSREQIEAEIVAADAAIKQAEADVRRLEAVVEFARAEYERALALSRTQSISAQALQKAKYEVESNEASLASAHAQVEVRRAVRASLAARLIDPKVVGDLTNPACCVEIRAPVTGRVLRIIQDSEAVVQAGTPLIDIGNPLDLEVVADLLSTEAVQIETGANVRIDGWGGALIRGRVTRVDPAGFLKISALGIEEQRVRVTIDFADPPEAWSRLGHDYRVTVHVTVWSSDNSLTVPVGALFRKGDSWAVFAVRDGRTQVVPIRIGHRNNRFAEVISGLSVGDRVVLHPSDRVSEGTRVAERETR
jgi:HlyD family secretion protein